MSFANPARPGDLPKLYAISVIPGDVLKHEIDLRNPEGVRIEVKLAHAPAGAKLVVDGVGKLYVHWQTTADLPAESLIVLTARNIDTGVVLERSKWVVSRSAAQSSRGNPAVKISAPKFEPFAHQYLQVGVPWQFKVNPSKNSGRQVYVVADDLPQGASLSESAKGEYRISWTPAQHQQGTYKTTLRAVDAELPNLHSAHQLIMTVKSKPLAEQLSAQNRINSRIPQIEPLSNQIISAGRVLSFKVKPYTSDNAQVLLQVDRLPRNASFEENTDGSRTFYWQTSDKDQGEHIFRFTAFHSQDKSLRAWREILIVVGDPSRSSTTPAKIPLGSIE